MQYLISTLSILTLGIVLAQDATCWSGVLQHDSCCPDEKGLGGLRSCFNHEYPLERCCGTNSFFSDEIHWHRLHEDSFLNQMKNESLSNSAAAFAPLLATLANEAFGEDLRNNLRHEPLKVVELGVQRGGFAKELLSLLNFTFQYTGVDPWVHQPGDVYEDGANLENRGQQENFIATIESLTDHWQHTRLLQVRSTEAARMFDDNSVDFLFIDGNHGEEGIKQDLAYWWPKMARGSLFTGHDYTFGKVGTTVEAFAAAKGRTVQLLELYQHTAWVITIPSEKVA